MSLLKSKSGPIALSITLLALLAGSAAAHADGAASKLFKAQRGVLFNGRNPVTGHGCQLTFAATTPASQEVQLAYGFNSPVARSIESRLGAELFKKRLFDRTLVHSIFSPLDLDCLLTVSRCQDWKLELEYDQDLRPVRLRSIREGIVIQACEIDSAG